MKSKENPIDYWFTIEPYVFIGLTNQHALLYNTLDKTVLESDKVEVINLLHDTIQKENCGVILLTNERYQHSDIHAFVDQLRKKFMGDIIDTTLSNSKPVQLLPYYNYLDKSIVFKDNYSTENKSVLENLSEISIFLDSNTNTEQLIPILKSIPKLEVFNIIGSIIDITKHNELLYFLGQHSSNKYILCSYMNMIDLRTILTNTFTYRISVDFPVNKKQWDNTMQILLNQPLPFEYIFNVTSERDCMQVEQLIEQFKINKYQVKPVYTGSNIIFFKKNIYLTKEDILSASISIKDFFIRQSMNVYDFGKINIMPNGDVYANLNHPILGNIYINSIYDIVQKEIDEGKSWFRIRNQVPCNSCIYQWLCPSPSNYEIAIGCSNLCHIKQSTIKEPQDIDSVKD